MKEIAVVILNWNGKHHLETYLPSVVENSSEADIIVIDNFSTDNSVEFLKEKYPQIKQIQNHSNGGFAKGYNDGLKKLKGEYKYYILLNSDVRVTPSWITPILKYLKANPEVSCAQPKILADKRPTFFEHAGAAGGFIDKNGYPFCRGRIFSEVEEDINQYNQSSEIFWATGACMFVNANIFHEIGGFDEDYFAHMEEIDLCWRMKLKGYKVYYCADSVVYHLGGGTLDYLSPRKVYLNFRNSLFTLYKNYQGNFLFFKILNRFLFDYIAVAMFLLKFDFKSTREVFRAQIHFFKHKKVLKIKRKHIQEAVVKKDLSGVFQKSIVWTFFLFRKKKFSDLNQSKITAQ